jgi:sulfite exporter TauE/SafE
MTELPLVMLAGLLGSSHCVGMCGGFAVMVGMSTTTCRQNVVTQVVYSLGRVMTYSTMGAGAGFLGWRLVERAPLLANVPAVLCILAGLFLVVEGMFATGFIRRRSPRSGLGVPCLAGPLFAAILKTPGFQNAFSAGILTGLLPCGLVYAFLSLAASTHDLFRGMGTMAAFGLGTIPLMVLTGSGTMLLSVEARKRLYRVAAWCVVITGLLTVYRGYAFLRSTPAAPAASCPFCRSAEAPSAE